MPFALKLRRNPSAPRLSLREHAAALKVSAAKVMGKGPARFTPPKPIGAGEPSKALAVLIDAHHLAYGRYLIARSDWTPDLDALRQAEEEAFRALLHSPLRSDADRVAYAIAVIERQSGALGDHVATGRDHPLSVAYRSLRFGEHAREMGAMRHVGHKGEPEASADPILAAIDAHRAAYTAWHPLMLAWGDTLAGTPEYEAAETIDAAARQCERNAFRALLTIRPTTSAGFVALAAYLPDAMRQANPDTEAEALAALDALRAGVMALGTVRANDAPEPAATEPAADMRVHIDDTRSGLMTFADAYGTLRTRPITEGLAFMAARLNAVARSEYSRRFNAKCGDLDAAACDALDARLRRELRLDALHILAFRFEQAFAEGQAERQGFTGAGASAAKVDLKPLTVLQLVNLHEAYQAARHLWEGVVARPYSVAWRDPRGCVHATPVGHLADFEETRAALVGERIINEITHRSPQNEKERDYILSLRLQHEIDCEDRIRDADIMREISQAWGA